MASYVFFSWQSDLPNLTGRSLIERSLEAAVKALHADATIEPAERVEVLSGTKGKAGTVPLADTIFERIDGASVVVTDLTYVSTRPGGGRSPNPNVLIEHGYALRSRSGARMIPVMNTAFGHPRQDPLPFDLAHMTWPVLFDCPPDGDADRRVAVRHALTKQLVSALKLIFGDDSLPPVVPLPEPHPHDVRLLEQVYATLPLAFRQFLAQQDFGVQFRASRLNPLHEIAEWVGATYEFNDRIIQDRFALVRQYAEELTELTSGHLYTYGENPQVASAKNERDRAHGTQPATRTTIREMNAAALHLAKALDDFEITARERIRTSPFEVAPSTWPSSA